MQTARALYFFVLLDLYKIMTFLEKIMIMDYNKTKATEFFVLRAVKRIDSGPSVVKIIIIIMLSFRANTSNNKK